MAEQNMTKTALAEALKDLMRKKPFARISVSDICESCGLNRKSFYYHFRDKYDLLNWIFYVDIVERIIALEEADAWDILEQMCEYFYEEREFYRNALDVRGQNSIRESFSATVWSLLQMNLDLEDMPDAPEVMYIDIAGDAFLSVVERWLGGKDPQPPKEFVGKLREEIVFFAKMVAGAEL